ncbi:MAG: glycoside hydrolase family 16 protein [Spirochaetaceae bacterium]|nr:glycoside hydrolase family 16 protein [Spirochaetaceae bacterium]
MRKKCNALFLLTILLLMSVAFSCDTGSGPEEVIDESDDYDPGPGWTLSWSDEFNDGVFGSDTWDREELLSPYNNEWERYTGEASTAYEQDGSMVLKATYNGPTHSIGNYTSARVISNPGGGTGLSGSTGKTFRYGKIAASIKLPSGKGIWPAFWMLGDNISETGGDTGWPACGEIDILESGHISANDGFYGHATVGQAIHSTAGTPSSSGEVSISSGIYGDDFHVFEIEWDSSTIVWKVDGVIAHTADISTIDEFQKDFYILFNIAVGGNYTHDPDATTTFPQYMYIDWIRYYTNN